MRILKIAEDDSITGKVWGGVFFNPGFTDPAKAIFGFSGDPVGIYRNDSIIMLSNLLRRERMSVRTATTPLLFQYYGAAVANENTGEDIIRVFHEYASSQCDFAVCNFPPEFPATDLEIFDWRIHKSVTLAVDRQGLNAWGSDFRDDVKNKLRKARREGVVIGDSQSLPAELWRVTFSRKDMATPVNPDDLKRWCDVLISRGLLKIYIASVDGKPVAFRGELIHGDFAYDWIAGSDPEFHSTGANQLLMAGIGDDMAKSGISTWDLVGGQIKSIYDFKKSFGASEYGSLTGKRSFGIRGKIFSMIRGIKYGG